MAAKSSISDIDAQIEKLRSGLPRHRDLLDKIREHGLQPV